MTETGWLHGTFYVPERQALMDYPATGVQLLKTTRIRFPGEKELVPSSRCAAGRSASHGAAVG
jgi:hypothetical protein